MVTKAMANEEAAAAWDNEAEGWIANADRYEQTGVRHWKRLLDSLTIGQDARILDVGCGPGTSTIELASRAPAGEATGLDISSRMLAYARQQAKEAGVRNATFVHGDAQVHPFRPDEFDSVVSVFGTMFFNDPAAALTNIRGGMKPGARLTMLTWRALAENEWLTAIRGSLASGRQLPEPPADQPGPFGLAGPDRVRAVLGSAGYAEVELLPVDEPMLFGSDADDAFEFLGTFGITRGLTQDLSEDDRRRALAALRQTVADHETPDGVLFGSAAWLVKAVA